MRTDEIRALTDADIKKQLEASHKELLDLRVKWTTKQLVNHRQMWKVKKEIARLETIIRERELGMSQAPAPKK